MTLLEARSTHSIIVTCPHRSVDQIANRAALFLGVPRSKSVAVSRKGRPLVQKVFGPGDTTPAFQATEVAGGKVRVIVSRRIQPDMAEYARARFALLS